jgi:hypothetical protein
MKKLPIVWALLVLYPQIVSAQDPRVDRYIDFLEPGNPGGWVTSLKTWDTEYTMHLGDVVAFDVWLGDIGGGGVIEASFLAEYDPSKLSVVAIEVFDGVHGPPGPWPPGDYISEYNYGSSAYCFVDCFYGFGDCIQPDNEGHTIIARTWLRRESCGDTVIEISDIPEL